MSTQHLQEDRSGVARSISEESETSPRSISRISEAPSLVEVDLDALAERVACLVVERLRAIPHERRWLTPAEVAEILAVERSWIYEHASELGARRLGAGPKARLRFRLEDVERATTCAAGRESRSAPERATEPKARRARRRRLGTKADLLPIRGRGDAP